MKLFEPFTINDKLTINNHIMMPPVVTRLATTKGEVTDALIDRYVLYGQGGAGIVVTEAVSVKRQKSGQLLRLSEDEFIPGMQQLTERFHGETDSKIAPQIIHFLKIARSGYRQTVNDLTSEEIQEIPELFARAAERARISGFDGVELHYAHAYTMAYMLSRYNHRKDEYGGSLKKRLLLAEQAVEATRKAVGDDFTLGVRMNGDEFALGGNSLIQGKAIALRLAELGLDYISVSAGGKFEDAIPSRGRSPGPLHRIQRSSLHAPQMDARKSECLSRRRNKENHQRGRIQHPGYYRRSHTNCRGCRKYSPERRSGHGGHCPAHSRGPLLA